MEKQKWSETAWNAAKPVYDRILAHPFVNALTDGSLSPDRFRYYLQQDTLYLQSYGRRLMTIADRLPQQDQRHDLRRFAADGIAMENSMHEYFLPGGIDCDLKMSATCLLYTSLLDAQSSNDIEVAAASVLPCFWIYREVGLYIFNRASRNLHDNPYRTWIETYADPFFEESTRRAIEICDELAAEASKETRQRMTDIFILCTKMEWMFWQSAWEMERWKI